MPALGHDRRPSRQGTFAIHCECPYREAKRRAVLTALNVTLSGVTSQHHVSPDLGVRSENGRGVKSAAHHAASLARADSYSNASSPHLTPQGLGCGAVRGMCQDCTVIKERGLLKLDTTVSPITHRENRMLVSRFIGLSAGGWRLARHRVQGSTGVTHRVS
jgi:hypothetical protein